MTAHDPLGYLASLLVLATFCMRGEEKPKDT